MKGYLALIVTAVLMFSEVSTADPYPEITGFSIAREPGRVVLELPPVVPPDVFELKSPYRLVLDLPGVSALPGAPYLSTIPIGKWGIERVRTRQFRSGSGGATTRIVLDLVEPAPWELQTSSGRPLLVITREGTEPGDTFRIGSLPPPPTAEDSLSVDVEPFPTTSDAEPIEPEEIDLRGPLNPSPEIISRRQLALWDRRGRDLLDEAELLFAAGDYRECLDRLSRLFHHYPTTPAAPEGHGLAVRVFCDLRLGRQALEHVTLVLDDAAAPDSLLEVCLADLVECGAQAASSDDLALAYEKASARLAPCRALSRLGGRLGLLLAESGAESERVLDLLATALLADPDAPEAALLHRAVGLCHERQGGYARASREHVFAARLLFGTDPELAIELRLRAADNLFRAGLIEAAAEKYRLIAGLEAASAEHRSWAEFQLGNCYYRTRRYAKAAETYESLRIAHPSSFWSEQAEARLAAIARSDAAR